MINTNEVSNVLSIDDYIKTYEIGKGDPQQLHTEMEWYSAIFNSHNRTRTDVLSTLTQMSTAIMDSYGIDEYQFKNNFNMVNLRLAQEAGTYR